MVVFFYYDITAHRVARDNLVQRMEEQQRDLLHRRQLRSDPEYQAHELQLNNMWRQQVRGNRQATFRVLNYEAENFCNTTDVGMLNYQCLNCGALKFERETDSLCCLKGNVKLDEFPKLQPFLQHLRI